MICRIESSDQWQTEGVISAIRMKKGSRQISISKIGRHRWIFKDEEWKRWGLVLQEAQGARAEEMLWKRKISEVTEDSLINKEAGRRALSILILRCRGGRGFMGSGPQEGKDKFTWWRGEGSQRSQGRSNIERAEKATGLRGKKFNGSEMTTSGLY